MVNDSRSKYHSVGMYISSAEDPVRLLDRTLAASSLLYAVLKLLIFFSQKNRQLWEFFLGILEQVPQYLYFSSAYFSR